MRNTAIFLIKPLRTCAKKLWAVPISYPALLILALMV